MEDLLADDLLAPAHGLAAPRYLGELLSRLRVERGYALASVEAEIGLTSRGNPLRYQVGERIAVANVSGPSSRLVGRVEEIVHWLRGVAADIEATPVQPHTG
ncbi:IclR family transcriptional regulator C-terminal domain-containing protein [Streptomyces sp. NPDC102364]|uniref:IclR family transcriptional regulator domain-containing protein n=1 Tax=Streptomyces sp. NPDC102364 TaxID=3366161 RepID=UPI003804FAE4